MAKIKGFRTFESQSGGWIKPGDEEYFKVISLPDYENPDYENPNRVYEGMNSRKITRFVKDALSGVLEIKRLAEIELVEFYFRGISHEVNLSSPLIPLFKRPTKDSPDKFNMLVWVMEELDDYYLVQMRSVLITKEGLFYFADTFFRADGDWGLKRLLVRIKDWVSDCQAAQGQTRKDITGEVISIQKKQGWRFYPFS
jgi:hypothetical protein